MRIGVANMLWPLDPTHAKGRDEVTLARALFSTPLRTDSADRRAPLGALLLLARNRQHLAAPLRPLRERSRLSSGGRRSSRPGASAHRTSTRS